MSADRQVKSSLAGPATGARSAKPNRCQYGLAVVSYWIEAGIATTAAGAWATKTLSGTARTAVWIGVTAVLAVGAMWLAEPSISVLSRYFAAAGPRRPPVDD